MIAKKIKVFGILSDRLRQQLAIDLHRTPARERQRPFREASLIAQADIAVTDEIPKEETAEVVKTVSEPAQPLR